MTLLLHTKRIARTLAGAFLLCVIGQSSQATDTAPISDGDGAPAVAARSSIDAGRYLVTIGACNDCHTPNWAETDGKLSETQWLIGSPIGWRGPWGTTYATNLRLLVKDLTEDSWVQMLRTRNVQPPMPWMNVNRLSDADSRAIYRFIRSLGHSGGRMPAATGPDTEPATPYYVLDPIQPSRVSMTSPTDAMEK